LSATRPDLRGVTAPDSRRRVSPATNKTRAPHSHAPPLSHSLRQKTLDLAARRRQPPPRRRLPPPAQPVGAPGLLLPNFLPLHRGMLTDSVGGFCRFQRARFFSGGGVAGSWRWGRRSATTTWRCPSATPRGSGRSSACCSLCGWYGPSILARRV
jgi:hypothetical protein